MLHTASPLRAFGRQLYTGFAGKFLKCAAEVKVFPLLDEREKVATFATSAGLVAMAGGVWAYYIGFVYPQFAIDPLITIGMVLMAYLGGKGTLWGPVLGAFILVPAQQYLAYRLGASQLYLVGYAAVFLGVMLLLPRGILPSLADRLATRRSARPASPEATKAVAAP